MGSFSRDLPRILSLGQSLRVAAGFARSGSLSDREGKAAARASSKAVRRDVILLLYAYPKNVTADLTPKQIAQLGKAVKEEFGNEKGDV
jgi:hypothetical protein